MTRPTWSVRELLSNYAAPKLSSETVARLHKLAALEAPDETSPEFHALKTEMEELIRLVEAVKLVDTTGVPSDGRIWPRGRGISLDENVSEDLGSRDVLAEHEGLLKHAMNTENGSYVVPSPPSGRSR
ncbi:hypothetical protein DL93DRAFT_2066320 [Clavulina sp. PMI_390]|nr:hypothetical protein DL93DRAFT_2066320 [Clavulina sp. PMI_390]